MTTPENRVADARLPRRRLLAATAAGAALMPAVAACSEQAPPQQAAAPCAPGTGKFNFTLPSFSVAERDRRWAAVREGMARPKWNLDAIITSGSDQWANNARYLTQVQWLRYAQPGPELLFPADPAKPVTVHLNAARHAQQWEERLAPGGWLADGKMVLKPVIGSEEMIALIRDQGYGAPGTRIGVAKLAGTRFDPEGLVSYTYLKALMDAFPGVEFVPIEDWGADPGPIEAASMVKSAEEVDALRLAVRAGEACIDALVAAAAARDAATIQADLWWQGFAAMYRVGGEDFVRLSVALDEDSNATIGDPVAHPVRTGQICNQEITGTHQGYGTQVNHGFFIGAATDPGYGYYAAAIEQSLEMHERCIGFIKPGVTTYLEFEDHAAQVAKDMNLVARGFNTHGGGIGYLSRPRSRKELDGEIVMVPGHVFDFKPTIRLAREAMADVGEENRPMQLGESYVVTETGAERLGTRDMGPRASG